MKNRLLVVLILMYARFALSQDYCNHPVIGPYAYDSNHARLFTHTSDKDGLYKVMVDDLAAYTDCGRKIKFKKGEYIYVDRAGAFYEGTFKGKTGKWAETIVDFDGSGPQSGTFIYAFFNDLKHEVRKYQYALGPDSKTNPFTHIKGQEGTYQIKSRKDVYNTKGKNYSALGPGDVIETHSNDFFQGSFKSKSGVWIRISVKNLESVYTPLSNLKIISLFLLQSSRKQLIKCLQAGLFLLVLLFL